MDEKTDTPIARPRVENILKNPEAIPRSLRAGMFIPKVLITGRRVPSESPSQHWNIKTCKRPGAVMKAVK